MSGVFHEPSEYTFRDRDGHSGKSFGTDSPKTGHLIIECSDRLTVSIREHESEFNYYILVGEGYFVIDNVKKAVAQGDLVLILPGTKYTFGGKLKMLLINTPHLNREKEEIIHES